MDHQDQRRKMRPSAKKKPVNVKSHYKATELCKFHRYGACTLGDQCTFAHKLEELKAKPSFQKTRLCNVYVNFGDCKMGSACKFAHSKEEMKEVATERRERSWLQMVSLGMQAADATLPPADVLSASISEPNCWDEWVTPATMPPACFSNATLSEPSCWDDLVSPATMPQACVPSTTLSEPSFQDEWISPATMSPACVLSETLSEPNCWNELVSPDFLAMPWPPTRLPGGSYANSTGPLWMPPPPEDESMAFTVASEHDGTGNSDEELQGLPLPLTISSTSGRKPHDYSGSDGACTGQGSDDIVPSLFGVSLGSKGGPTSSTEPTHIPLPLFLLRQSA